ncbi:uncharacterized protein LOC112494000 isoform X3 [Cephus cinctus]|uniref:Uncharacterized protein LOC112494000 isoform X3 n=1 Tax=Cephus cinctus TaxID=211228 RepID=A0AAJ7RD55_CEPCN|nr:uncharacterized protein LOC112494000 isoform X3 [Cephus cinctus]
MTKLSLSTGIRIRSNPSAAGEHPEHNAGCELSAASTLRSSVNTSEFFVTLLRWYIASRSNCNTQ